MATLTPYNALSLMELATRKDPNGNLAVIAEVLTKDNPILQDAPWQEANGASFHKVVRRASLPKGAWRKLNQGVPKESSRTTPVNETLGMLETYSEVDKAIVDLSGNPAKARNDEAAAFVEGLSQTFSATMMYGNTATDVEQFTGLAPRLGKLAAGQVVTAGGAGADLTSIYIVQWGENKVFMAYPKGSATTGIEHNDLGQVTLQDDSGNNYEGFRDHFKIHGGLVVKDPRCVKRVCNIETTGTLNIFDPGLLIELLNQMPQGGAGATIYVNKTLKTQMDKNAMDKANVLYGSGEVWGQPTTTFRTIPVRQCDAILDTESEVL